MGDLTTPSQTAPQSEKCGFCSDGIYYPPPTTVWAERQVPAGHRCPYCDGTGEAQ